MCVSVGVCVFVGGWVGVYTHNCREREKEEKRNKKKEIEREKERKREREKEREATGRQQRACAASAAATRPPPYITPLSPVLKGQRTHIINTYVTSSYTYVTSSYTLHHHYHQHSKVSAIFTE